MSGTPTNPETTDRAIVARDVIELYRQGIPGAMDAGVPKFLAEAVLTLLTERDALKAARDEIESYGDLRVMRADLAEARSQLAYAREERDEAQLALRHSEQHLKEAVEAEDEAEATLTRYREGVASALTSLGTGPMKDGYAYAVLAALDVPKEEET